MKKIVEKIVALFANRVVMDEIEVYPTAPHVTTRVTFFGKPAATDLIGRAYIP